MHLPHRYGDNSPTAPVSKVFFIFYSLIAVPIIASFAVQTVAAVLSTVAERRVELNRAVRETRALAAKAKLALPNGDQSQPESEKTPSHHQKGTSTASSWTKHFRLHRNKETFAEVADDVIEGDTDDDEEGEENDEFKAHARFVMEHWDEYDEEIKRENGKVDDEEEEGEEEAYEDEEVDEETRVKLKQDRLAKETLELACRLESQARALLIMALPRSVQIAVPISLLHERID